MRAPDTLSVPPCSWLALRLLKRIRAIVQLSGSQSTKSQFPGADAYTPLSEGLKPRPRGAVQVTGHEFESATSTFRELQNWTAKRKPGTGCVRRRKGKSLVPPRGENAQSQGPWGSWKGHTPSSAAPPQPLPNTECVNSKSYLAPQIWRRSWSRNQDSERRAGWDARLGDPSAVHSC